MDFHDAVLHAVGKPAPAVVAQQVKKPGITITEHPAPSFKYYNFGTQFSVMNSTAATSTNVVFQKYFYY